MMRIIKSAFILFVGLLVLGACNNDTSKDKVENDDNGVESVIPDEEEDVNDSKGEEGQDQLDLLVGDTGTFVTTLGTYEMTLNDAALKGKEFEGVKSTRDDIILLDITIKNTDDDTLDLEDLIYSMEIADDLEGAGSGDNAEGFDTVDAFKGEIEPGEEKSAQFLTTVNTADEYFFRKDSGIVATKGSNQVIWTIKTEEIK